MRGFLLKVKVIDSNNRLFYEKEYFSVTLSLNDIQSVSLKLAGVLDCRFLIPDVKFIP